MRKQVKVNAICYAHLVKNLMHGDMTCRELAEETGLYYTTVLQYARELHAVGAVHIARYDPDPRGRHIVKVYKLGKGKDAKRFRMTNYEIQKRYKEKKKLLANPMFRIGDTHGQLANRHA